MHDLPAKSQWTGTRTITAAGNRTCVITLRLSDFRSQTSLTLLLRNYELTSENVYFLTNQSKTKTFIDLKITRKPKPTKNSTRPYLNEIPAQKRGLTGPSYTIPSFYTNSFFYLQIFDCPFDDGSLKIFYSDSLSTAPSSGAIVLHSFPITLLFSIRSVKCEVRHSIWVISVISSAHQPSC